MGFPQYPLSTGPAPAETVPLRKGARPAIGLRVRPKTRNDAAVPSHSIPMGNHAPQPVKAKAEITIGSFVQIMADALCPQMWQPLARHLKAGTRFQVVATAQGFHGCTLVLQPWPCLAVFPEYVLAPSDCIGLAYSTTNLHFILTSTSDFDEVPVK